MISCWTPARSRLPSARVSPKLAKSVRSSGLAICRTSVLCSSPSAPRLTSLTVQARRLYLNGKTGLKIPPSGLVPPTSRQCQHIPRILLDEDVPAGLRHLVPDHEVRTVPAMGWAGMANGQLLAAAE